MKVSIIVPPSMKKIPERIYGCSYQLYPQPEIPSLYVASVLEKENDVDFRDFPLEDNSKKKFEDYIKFSEAEIFIIHSVLLSQKIDIMAAEMIRKIKPDVFIIFFGPEPTRVPNFFLFDEKCFVARGEAEIIIKNLINCLKNHGKLNKVNGISYKIKNKIYHNQTFGIIENVDKIPFPSRKLVEKYKNKFYNPKINKKPYTLILASRGCAFRCYYCVPNSISWAREIEWKKYHKGKKPPVRFRSAENVIREFKQLKKEGYKSVWVMDDMFLWGKGRINRILNGIKDTGIEFGILARADFIEKDTIKLLKCAGCKLIDIGVESFDQRVLDYVKKDLKVDTIYKAINTIKNENMDFEINLMMGTCPIETKFGIKETVKKAIDLDVNYVLFSIATPFPGTELYEVAEKQNWLIKEKMDNIIETLDPSTKAMMQLPNLKSNELESLQRYAKRRFYFRPRYIKNALIGIRSPREFRDLIKTALKLLK